MDRIDGRTGDQLRPVGFELGIAPHAGDSVLVTMGNTRVICGVMIEEAVPRWMKEQNVTDCGIFHVAMLNADTKASRYHERKT
jgi:ribonuclease PH